MRRTRIRNTGYMMGSLCLEVFAIRKSFSIGDNDCSEHSSKWRYFIKS